MTANASPVTSRTPIRFSQNPARHICGIVCSPDPKTMALGGVATGIMNAQLAASAAGTITRYGLTPSLGARAARIGTSVAGGVR